MYTLAMLSSYSWRTLVNQINLHNSGVIVKQVLDIQPSELPIIGGISLLYIYCAHSSSSRGLEEARHNCMLNLCQLQSAPRLLHVWMCYQACPVD